MTNGGKLLLVIGALAAFVLVDRYLLGGAVEMDAEVELPIPLGLFWSRGERYRVEITTESPLMLKWALKDPTGTEIEHSRELTPRQGERSLRFRADRDGAHTLDLQLGKRDFDEAPKSRRARIVVSRGGGQILSPIIDQLMH